MNLHTKIKNRFQSSGIRGETASALRATAAIIDQKDKDENLKNADTQVVPNIESDDVFLKWLRFAVPGMLQPGNINATAYAIVKMPRGKPILEIGSFCGLSTVVLSYFLENDSIKSPLFTCDK